MNLFCMELMWKTNQSKNFTLFIPIYVLDTSLQNSEGAGQKKWGPSSRIRVYLGHLPFHAGCVALVWNLNTGCVSPK